MSSIYVINQNKRASDIHNIPQSISHKPKQVRFLPFECNNPRSLRHICHLPKEARFNCSIPRSLSHIPKEARFNCNIPRSISHKPQEARFKCNILRSMSHIPKQACFKCNIPRSISHIPNQAPFNYNIPRSTSHKQQEAPFKCNISRSILAINHKKRASTVMFLATSLSSKKTTRARSALSNRPHFLWLYRRDNPRGMLEEHEIPSGLSRRKPIESIVHCFYKITLSFL